MMQILLQNHDQSQRLKKITCTELRLPEVIEWQGRFYRRSGERGILGECRGARLAKLIFTPAKD
ncbi:MAG: hypothetical protein JGK13_31745 [Microcoleus sp. PH2017_37_MFU_D_B]|uniref:hypothetical protein n=1 Tax=Microcoleus sp. PH2017_37_MFU_D_B TaxID=2798847 RepID=UPI001DD7FE65|nr:hypothetical protein [Microcoleus sp. PH2017_37_MFU_D_B]MCC3638867.1 hypothetical protein [Microcoleus sp. PH2017_37_MFU_D_B]